MRLFRREHKDAPPRNERIERDTRAPKSDAPKEGDRRGRLRVLLGVGKVASALGIAGLVVWGAIGGYRHATTSPYFGLREVGIEGNERLSREEILAAGRLEQGENLFSIDVGEVAARLRAHPWIRDAEVRRRLPSSVSVTLSEHRARMLVLFEVPYLVDEDAEIFKRWTPRDPIVAPMLTGLTRERYVADEEGAMETIRAAIALSDGYREAGLETRAPLREIHYEVDGGFSLTAGDEPFYVRFGKGPYRRKFAMLATLLARMKRDGEHPAIIHFDNEVRPDRVTVKVKGAPKKAAGVELTDAR